MANVKVLRQVLDENNKIHWVPFVIDESEILEDEFPFELPVNNPESIEFAEAPIESKPKDSTLE